MAYKEHKFYLERTVDVAERAKSNGNGAFGSILVDKNGEILLEIENAVYTQKDCTAHAELLLVKEAYKKYEADFLMECTIYCSTEPCVMCSGAIFWARIGRIVYATNEDDLAKNLDNYSCDTFLKISCKAVFDNYKNMKVIGPFDEFKDKILYLNS